MVRNAIAMFGTKTMAIPWRKNLKVKKNDGKYLVISIFSFQYLSWRFLPIYAFISTLHEPPVGKPIQIQPTQKNQLRSKSTITIFHPSVRANFIAFARFVIDYSKEKKTTNYFVCAKVKRFSFFATTIISIENFLIVWIKTPAIVIHS